MQIAWKTIWNGNRLGWVIYTSQALIFNIMKKKKQQLQQSPESI